MSVGAVDESEGTGTLLLTAETVYDELPVTYDLDITDGPELTVITSAPIKYGSSSNYRTVPAGKYTDAGNLASEGTGRYTFGSFDLSSPSSSIFIESSNLYIDFNWESYFSYVDYKSLHFTGQPMYLWLYCFGEEFYHGMAPLRYQLLLNGEPVGDEHSYSSSIDYYLDMETKTLSLIHI